MYKVLLHILKSYKCKVNKAVKFLLVIHNKRCKKKNSVLYLKSIRIMHHNVTTW